MSIKIGQALVQAKKISAEQLRDAIRQQKTTGSLLSTALVKLGYISEEEILDTLSQRYGIKAVNLNEVQFDREAVRLIPDNIARKYQILPLERKGATLAVAMADPGNVAVIDDLRFLTGKNIEPVLATDGAIRAAIQKAYGSSYEMKVKEVMDEFRVNGSNNLEFASTSEDADIATITRDAEGAPVIRLVNLILTEAMERSASDIHIEPYEQELRVRFRIDGILYELLNPPIELKFAIVSRIKILAALDIAERRLPQDGRIKIRVNIKGQTKEVDIRVSILPTIYGEKVVMRILDKENIQFDMTQLGFEKVSLRWFEDAIAQPFGMVLVTGPTGSGKTNTLYSALHQLNKAETNILTVEDPVEFQLNGINQVQTKEMIGLTFAASLRAFLRQDPNIVMVGEIRDFETAEIAIKAALTGHLVLSTLHTNDAPSTINRLVNMGVEPYLVATSVLVVEAQRLVRRICPKCRGPASIPPKVLVDVGFSPEEANTLRTYKGKGCSQCGMTGYKGRIGLFEVMRISDDIREMVLNGSSASELRRKSLEEGMVSLRHSGLHKVRQGVTSVDEILRETMRS